MKRLAAVLLAFTLAGCGATPGAPVVRAAGEVAAQAAKSPVAAAFAEALEAKYGALYTPPGAKTRLEKVETYTISGGTTRVRGLVVVETTGYTARLEAMAALSKAEKVTADYFPTFGSAVVKGGKDDLAAAAAYAVRIQRLDREQLGDKKKALGAVVDPKKYEVKVVLRDDKASMIAEVSYQCEGFLGKGSTFTEYYGVTGKRGRQVTLDDVTYIDNKATDPNGNDLDG